MIMMLLDIARGREADFGRLFGGGRYMISLILATLLLYLVIIGLSLVSAIPAVIVLAVVGKNPQAGSIVAVVALFAFYAVLMIILSLRLSFYSYLIVDRNLGAFDSLRGSYQITRGHAWQILGLFLLAFLINVAGLIACLVGLVFTMPYTMLLLVVAYLSLSGSPAADPYAKGQLPPDLDVI